LITLGVLARIVLVAVVPLDPEYADNLSAILLSLPVLLTGHTPYIFHNFGNHVNPMPYLPWTVIGYIPAYLFGIELRWTNIIISTSLPLIIWWLGRTARLTSISRYRLLLLISLYYALPIAVGKDLYTEWQLFTAMIALTFSLLILRRARPAAAAFGVAAGAMPVAAFFVVPLLLHTWRTRPRAELLVLAAIIGATAGIPALIFLGLDPAAMISALVSPTQEFSEKLARGETTWPYLMIWHTVLGRWLILLEPIVLVVIALLAWRFAESARLTVAVSTLGYLALVLVAPLVVPHMFMPLLPLIVIGEAARAMVLPRAVSPRAPRAAPAHRIGAQPAR
jgi:hypothetical protein